MNDDKTMLSALMDGETGPVDTDRVLHALRRDKEMLNTWRRWHAVGGIMRNEDADYTGDAAAVQRICAAIADEPVQLAPHRSPLRRAMRPAAGLAVAASVAAMVVFGLRGTNLFEPQIPGAQTVAQVPVQDPVSWHTLPPELQHTLNTYLVEHGEFTPAPGMNGLSSYARFVSYDDPR